MGIITIDILHINAHGEIIFKSFSKNQTRPSKSRVTRVANTDYYKIYTTGREIGDLIFFL